MKFPRVRCLVCGRETAGTRDGRPWTHSKPGPRERHYWNRCVGAHLPGRPLVRPMYLRTAPERGAECYGDRVANAYFAGAERGE